MRKLEMVERKDDKMEKQVKTALELIDFALKSDVDYIYVLEDLQKILEEKKETFNKDHYWN